MNLLEQARLACQIRALRTRVGDDPALALLARVIELEFGVSKYPYATPNHHTVAPSLALSSSPTGSLATDAASNRTVGS